MNTRKIKTIAVEKLFGMYDYELTVSPVAEDNVFIIYGDNGTGKSTLLRLTYHLLAPDMNLSHKSYLANVAFKRFFVEFNDGVRVSAKRDDENEDYIGEYTLFYQRNGRLDCTIPCVWNDERHQFIVNYSEFSLLSRKNYRMINAELKSINVFYISDNRNEEQQDVTDIRNRRVLSSDPVEREREQLQDWVISQALEANKKGEEGTTAVYVKILSKLGKRRSKKEKVLSIEEIVKEIETLEQRATSYAEIGFIPMTNYTAIKSYLAKVYKTRQEATANILEPYLETQKNRLDALDHLFETISYLCRSLNEYLYKKRVIYSVNDGFKFYHNNGDSTLNVNEKDVVSVKKLSSGERQLLRLFSMVIRKSNVCPIIVIDEPEISLNIKWQRRLLDTLNYFVRNSEAQFIIATHSFEILSSHLDNTVLVGHPYVPKAND